MKSFEAMVTRIFGNRAVSWRCESDPSLLREYLVINLNDEPTGQDKASIIEYLKSRYPEVFVIENHHTRESDFQLRVYTR